MYASLPCICENFGSIACALACTGMLSLSEFTSVPKAGAATSSEQDVAGVVE